MALRTLLCLVLVLASCRAPPAKPSADRIVSLSPSITETLFAIGAGDHVVGVTDFDTEPPEVRMRTRAGSMLQPNYEVIARLHPTLIMGEQVRNAPIDRLNAIAPTRVLPWLSIDEVVSSVREVGQLSDHATGADELAARLAQLTPVSSPVARRTLLVVADTPGPLSEIWYVKRGSLHGTALEAAGGRNAVADQVSGAPVLSLERLVAVDPDIVLLLVAHDVTDDERRQYVDSWSAFPIKAVRRHAVRVIAGADVQSTGPGILKLRDRLRSTLHELEAAQ